MRVSGMQLQGSAACACCSMLFLLFLLFLLFVLFLLRMQLVLCMLMRTSDSS